MFTSHPLRARRLSFALIAAILSCGYGIAAGQEPLKSGPQVGARLPGGFVALNVTNAELPGSAGKKSDYVEQHGQDPTVLVFAREVTAPLTNLIRELDVKAGRNKSARLRAVVVVVLSDDEGLEQTLQSL